MVRLRLFSVVLALALVLAGCGAGSGAAEPTAAPSGEPTAAAPSTATGGTLRVGRTAAPDSLNPGAAYIAEAYDLFLLVYDSLITTDQLLQPQPQLADAWSVAEDGKTWTFQLNSGAKWHDGRPLTSEDVKFTYDMLRTLDGFGYFSSYVTLIASVEAPDPTTAVIAFEQPVANIVERFSSVYILPKHIWEPLLDPANPADSTKAVEFENLEMVGSGPFRMAEYKPGEFTRLTAVKDHYLDPPHIDEVIFQVFGNGDAMTQALRTGAIDLMTVPNKTIVRSLQSEANIKVEIGNQLHFADIIFNTTAPENCPPDDGVCSGHPALRDVRVRQALAHATDKQQLIDVVLIGLGVPGLSLVTPGHGDAFASQVQDYAFDLAKANQILDEAGYKDSDGDSVREMPDDPSKPLAFRYSYPSDQSQEGQRFFELLKEMWGQAGVKLELTPLEADALTAACCPAFDFDVINWGWFPGVDPSSLLYVATIAEIPTGNSESGYANPEYDKLFEQQQVTIDVAERNKILHEMQAILVRDVPYIIPYYDQAVDAYRSDRFTGWVVEPKGVLSLSARTSVTVIRPVQ